MHEAERICELAEEFMGLRDKLTLFVEEVQKALDKDPTYKYAIERQMLTQMMVDIQVMFAKGNVQRRVTEALLDVADRMYLEGV